MSTKLGTAGGYPFFIGNLISWALYHTYYGLENKSITGHYWTKDTSTYYDHHTGEFRFSRLLGPISRGLVQVATFFAVFYTMGLASQAAINQGIIASLFSISIVFSAIIFYFLYDEALSSRHFLGLAFMILSVVLISIGKDHASPVTDSPLTSISEE